MGRSEECHVVLLVLVACLTGTVIGFLSLRGQKWVMYQDGYSGLWNDCNTTMANDNSQSSTSRGSDDKKEEAHCTYIHISEAPDLLHPIRACMITGYIVWCLGMMMRYCTWNKRGSPSDRSIIIAAFVASALIFSACFMFTFRYFWSEFDNNNDTKKYVNPTFGDDHAMAYIAASLYAFTGGLIIYHYRMLNRSNFSFSLTKHCSFCYTYCRVLGCCGQSSTPGTSSTEVEPTRLSIRATDSTSTSTNRQSRSNRRRDRVSGAETAENVSVISVGVTSEASGQSTSDRHVVPVDGMVLPPAYGDVIGDGTTRQDILNNLPPSYSDVIANRELILSPPPAYSTV